MNDLIAALKRCIDDDGHMHLDRDQTLYLMFIMYEFLELGPTVRDAAGVQYAILDFLGVVGDKNEEASA